MIFQDNNREASIHYLKIIKTLSWDIEHLHQNMII
ncbi:Uncharacterized protein BM_BM13300 [Brugia malayi]|uniref:Bm13300 n=1 Tax=Brugia malayi TaxID=6279 RepID=A0A0J9Y1G3_BRUMA|nr:Uncharacterized protein BM_BM13300 [Brugia malayi]CDQ00256.1 Bm13300 [Brugia malayi]VIO90951.1 Uncharacterized protein BM_BM13300 [Brugia malayi]